MRSEWKKIIKPGLSDIYEINIEGEVRNSITGKILKTSISNSGYRFISLTKKHLKYYIHRLIVENFVGKFYGEYKEVNHKNGNRLNNSIDNLEICSRSQNLQHMHRVLGVKVHNQKLNADIAKKIRKIYKAGGISQKNLGKKFGVSPMTVNRLLKHVQKNYA